MSGAAPELERGELILTITEAMLSVKEPVNDVILATHIADSLIEAGYTKKPF